MSASSVLLQRARETLGAARLLLEAGHFSDSVSRAYYAAFYAAEAALLNEGITPRTHKGVHALFDQQFVKTGLLPKETGAYLGGPSMRVN